VNSALYVIGQIRRLSQLNWMYR